MYNSIINFEFDPNKSATNKDKHGIDFNDAQALWSDPQRVEIPVKYVDKPRYLAVERVNGKHWPAVVTYRGGNVRLISVRRSRKKEVDLVDLYEGFRV